MSYCIQSRFSQFQWRFESPVDIAMQQYLDALDTWTCGVEGYHCECNGEVRYGFGSHWTPWQDNSGHMSCQQESFGNVDPISGQKKLCQCRRAYDSSLPDGQISRCSTLDRTFACEGNGNLIWIVAEPNEANGARTLTKESCQAECAKYERDGCCQWYHNGACRFSPGGTRFVHGNAGVQPNVYAGQCSAHMWRLETMGSDNCPFSAPSQQECLDAARTLSRSRATSGLVVGSWSNIPSGCSLQTGGIGSMRNNVAIFNLNQAGVNNGNYSPIC